MSPAPISSWKLSRGVSFSLLLLLTLSFQGSRGLWEPDEGRYGSIAVTMLDSGEWLLPNLAGLHFIDKPPLLFWGMAGGIAALGRNEWGARFCLCLFYLLTAVAIAGLGRALWDRETGDTAAVVWGASLLPFLASNTATPDLALACFSAWTWVGVVRAARADDSGKRRLAWLFAGLAAGLGLLTKGPALLVELLPLLVFVLVDRKLSLGAAIRGIALAGSCALAVAAIWYLPILLTVPGASSYLFDNQVTGRLFGARYERSPGLAGALATYLPTLLAGALPWWPAAVAAAVRSARPLGSRAFASAVLRSPAASLIATGVLVPIVVFSVAGSKLPFYLLPAWTPFALGVARLLGPQMRTSARFRIWFLIWVGALLAIKAGAAYLPVGAKDSRELARGIQRRIDDRTTGVIVVSAQANGLTFYGVEDFHWLRWGDNPYPLFAPPPKIEAALPRIAREGRSHLVLVMPAYARETKVRFQRLDWNCGDEARLARFTAFVCSPAAPAASGAPREPR